MRLTGSFQITRFQGMSGAVRESVDSAVPVRVPSCVSGPSATLKVICPFYGEDGPTPARGPRRSEARRGSRWVGPHRRGPRGEAKRDVGAGGWAHTGEGPAAKRCETWEPVGGPTPARAPRRSVARRGSRWVGPHRRGPRGEAERDVGAGGWAHTGEGPAAKRSETWEPVGGPTPARAPRRSGARRGSRWVGPHRRGARGEAKR